MEKVPRAYSQHIQCCIRHGILLHMVSGVRLKPLELSFTQNFCIPKHRRIHHTKFLWINFRNVGACPHDSGYRCSSECIHYFSIRWSGRTTCTIGMHRIHASMHLGCTDLRRPGQLQHWQRSPCHANCHGARCSCFLISLVCTKASVAETYTHERPSLRCLFTTVVTVMVYSGQASAAQIDLRSFSRGTNTINSPHVHNHGSTDISGSRASTIEAHELSLSAQICVGIMAGLYITRSSFVLYSILRLREINHPGRNNSGAQVWVHDLY